MKLIGFLLRLKLFYIVAFVGLCNVYGQSGVNQISSTPEKSLFLVRNYYNSLSINIENESIKSNMYGMYGELQSADNSSVDNLSYTYSSHEYDFNLGLYYYPSRLYSPAIKRFFQPDPKGQYVSPYLFVNADPVNTIDYNGKEGKTLILYERDGTMPGGYSKYDQELFDNIGDSYQYSLTDFVNGEVGDIPEWNGKVFVTAHTNSQLGDEIEAEVGDLKDLKDFKGNPSLKVGYAYEGKFDMGLGAHDLGHRLGRFSKERGVPIKSVSVNGCGSDAAASRIGEAIGFEYQGGEGTNTLRLVGVKSGRHAGWVGPKSSTSEDVEGVDGFQYFVIPDDAEIKTDEEFYTDGTSKVKGYYFETPEGKKFKTRYTDENGLKDIVDGRVPKDLKGSLKSFELKY